MLHSRFPLAIYFTHGSVYMSMPLTIQKDTCTPMFIAALFIIARTQKQYDMSINRWMDKENVVHIYNGILRVCWVTQSCPTLCNSMDCSLPVSSVHGIFQAVYWLGFPFPTPGESSWPRGWNCISCTGRWILYHRATWEVHSKSYLPHLYNTLVMTKLERWEAA